MPAWAVIGAYFDSQVRAGRLKPAPFFPRLLSLGGPVWAYLTARRTFSGVTGGDLDPEEMVDTHVDTFLAGNATPAYLAAVRRRRAKDDPDR